MTRYSRPPRRSAARQAEQDAIDARRAAAPPTPPQEPTSPPDAPAPRAELTPTPGDGTGHNRSIQRAGAEAALIEAEDEIARLEAANARLTAMLAQQPGYRKSPKAIPG